MKAKQNNKISSKDEAFYVILKLAKLLLNLSLYIDLKINNV